MSIYLYTHEYDYISYRRHLGTSLIVIEIEISFKCEAIQKNLKKKNIYIYYIFCIYRW